MNVLGKPTRSISVEADGWSVGVIDQTRLPHHFATARLTTADDAARDRWRSSRRPGAQGAGAGASDRLTRAVS